MTARRGCCRWAGGPRWRRWPPPGWGCAFDLTLNDIDPDALDAARAELAGSAVRLHVEPGNPLRSAARRRDQPFDLILAGGLFDYLPEKHFHRVVANLCGALAPGGRLCFTNLAAGNPFRPWMEYAADWRLIHRTADALSAAIPDGYRPASAANHRG